MVLLTSMSRLPRPRRSARCHGRFRAAARLLCGVLCTAMTGGSLGVPIAHARTPRSDGARSGAGSGTGSGSGSSSGSGSGSEPRSDRSRRTTPDESASAQKLARAKLAYQRGDYGAVLSMLRPMLYPQVLLAQEEQVLLAHKLLALSYFFEHDEANAEQEFNLLLSLRPDFALDPVVEPLKAVSFLDDIKRRNEQRLAEIRRRQAEEEQRQRAEAEQIERQAEELARKQTRRVYLERVVQKRLSALDFLPLGVPQFVGGRRVLGGVLATGEVLTGAASLGAWLAVRLRYPDSTFPPRELTTARALTATYLSTGVAFWGLILTGLIDAILHARTRVDVRRLPGPPADMPLERDEQLDGKPDARPDARPDDKPASKPDTRPDARPDARETRTGVRLQPLTGTLDLMPGAAGLGGAGAVGTPAAAFGLSLEGRF